MSRAILVLFLTLPSSAYAEDPIYTGPVVRPTGDPIFAPLCPGGVMFDGFCHQSNEDIEAILDLGPTQLWDFGACTDSSGNTISGCLRVLVDEGIPNSRTAYYLSDNVCSLVDLPGCTFGYQAALRTEYEQNFAVGPWGYHRVFDMKRQVPMTIPSSEPGIAWMWADMYDSRIEDWQHDRVGGWTEGLVLTDLHPDGTILEEDRFEVDVWTTRDSTPADYTTTQQCDDKFDLYEALNKQKYDSQVTWCNKRFPTGASVPVPPLMTTWDLTFCDDDALEDYDAENVRLKAERIECKHEPWRYLDGVSRPADDDDEPVENPYLDTAWGSTTSSTETGCFVGDISVTGLVNWTDDQGWHHECVVDGERFCGTDAYGECYCDEAVSWDMTTARECVSTDA